MLCERKCPITGEYNTLELPITQDEYDRAFMAWKGGTLIQNAFPMLTVDLREFIKTGITPAMWARLFDGADEE